MSGVWFGFGFILVGVWVLLWMFVIVFGGCCVCMVVVCLASLFMGVVWLV